MSGYGNLGRSISTGIGSFFGNNQARQAGEMAGLQQVALGDQIEQRRQAALFDQQKAQRDQEIHALGDPKQALGRIAAGFAVPSNSLPAVEQFMRTGEVPMIPAEPLAPGLQGPEAPPQMPPGIDRETLTGIAQMFLADQSVRAGSAKTMEDAIKAMVLRPQVTLTKGLADGSIAPGTGGVRIAAMGGKPLFNSDANGAVLDMFGGGLNEESRLAQGAIGVRAAQAAAQKANAAQSYASADASRASAAQTRAETAAGVSTGGTGGRAPVGYRWGATGNLEAIPGGPADSSAKVGKLPAEVQRMNIALRSLDEGLQAYEDKLGSFNARSFDQLNPNDRAGIESLVADLRLQLKEAQALGALTGPDMEILDQALASPSSLRGALYGNGGLKTQLKEVRSSLQRRKNALAAEYGRPELAATAAPATPAAVARTTPRPSSPTAQTDPVPVTSDADYLNLPSGTRFRAPDGTIRVKP